MHSARIVAMPDEKSRALWRPAEQVGNRPREIRLLCGNAEDDAEMRGDFAGVIRKLRAVSHLAAEALELHGKAVR